MSVKLYLLYTKYYASAAGVGGRILGAILLSAPVLWQQGAHGGCVHAYAQRRGVQNYILYILYTIYYILCL
jgi:hypothetical protein